MDIFDDWCAYHDPESITTPTKEDIMKTYTAIVLGLALATSRLIAQDTDKKAERPYLIPTTNCNATVLERAGKAYLSNLSSDNDGVLESTIAYVTFMRAAAPAENMQEIEATLFRLSNNGRTPAIRYKAYLAGLVFANPKMFSTETAAEYATGDEFFTAVSSRLQKTLLGYNAN